MADSASTSGAAAAGRGSSAPATSCPSPADRRAAGRGPRRARSRARAGPRAARGPRRGPRPGTAPAPDVPRRRAATERRSRLRHGIDRGRDRRSASRRPPSNQLHGVAERLRADRVDPVHQRGLVKAVCGHDHPAQAAPGERRNHRQDPGHRSDLAAERQFPTRALRAPEPPPHLLRSEQDPERDRQVQRRACLALLRGARLTVIRRGGWTKPALRIAPRTRSRASWKRGVREADDREPGRPPATSTSTRTTVRRGRRPLPTAAWQARPDRTGEGLTAAHPPLICDLPERLERAGRAATWPPRSRLARRRPAAACRRPGRSRAATVQAASRPS